MNEEVLCGQVAVSQTFPNWIFGKWKHGLILTHTQVVLTLSQSVTRCQKPFALTRLSVRVHHPRRVRLQAPQLAYDDGNADRMFSLPLRNGCVFFRGPPTMVVSFCFPFQVKTDALIKRHIRPISHFGTRASGKSGRV